MVRIVGVAIVKLETQIVGLCWSCSFRCVKAVFYACIVHQPITLAADVGVSGLDVLERNRSFEPNT